MEQRKIKTLKDICLENVSSFILGISPNKLDARKIRASASHFHLPLTLSQELFDFCIKQTATDDINRVLEFFTEAATQTPLQKLHLENSKRANLRLVQDLVRVNKVNLTYVDVRGCHGFSKSFWPLINGAEKLHTLKTTDLLVPLQCPSLQVLVVDWRPRKPLQKAKSFFSSTYYDSLLENVLPNLKYLDLSWCHWVKKLKCIGKAKRLEVLLLRNSIFSTNTMEDIFQLKSLRVLDISIGLERFSNGVIFPGNFPNPRETLEKIVEALENLEHLNISGTNLLPELSALESRQKKPFKFLGAYSTSSEEQISCDLPAIDIAGSNCDVMIIESIKKNYDMPRTLEDQFWNLRSLADNRFILSHKKLLAKQLVAVVKSLREIESEWFVVWTLDCIQYFLKHFLSPNEILPEDIAVDLFFAVNRLIHSFPKNENISETIMIPFFQTCTYLLMHACHPNERKIKRTYGKEFRKEIFRLSDFLMSLSSVSFVYLQTEASLFRLLYRVSLIEEAASYLGDNEIILRCFHYFRNLQICMGFSISRREASEIVPIVWKSIFNYFFASSFEAADFLKHNGLSVMEAHFNWFKNYSETMMELKQTFRDILNLIEERNKIDKLMVTPSVWERMRDLRNLIEKY